MARPELKIVSSPVQEEEKRPRRSARARGNWGDATFDTILARPEYKKYAEIILFKGYYIPGKLRKK